MHPSKRDIVDLTFDTAKPQAAGHQDAPHSSGPTRQFLRLYFRCANQYARAYQNAAGNGYCGRCPQCGKTIDFGVGQGGTSQRSFFVSCR